GVRRVEGTVRIDPGSGQTLLLKVADRLQEKGGLPTGRRTEEFRDPAARETTNAEGLIEGRETGGDGGAFEPSGSAFRSGRAFHAGESEANGALPVYFLHGR